MARRRPESTANPARGAILVVVAVALGLLLLRNGIDTSVQVTANDAPPATAPEDEVPDEEAPDEVDPTTTVTEPVRPPAEVRVLVLNASGTTGAAGRWSDGLEAQGYQMLPAANAPDRVEVTRVLHQEGFEAEAEEVVSALGSPPGVGAEPIGAEELGEIGDASVVVLVGPDIAEAEPPAGEEPAAEEPTAEEPTADEPAAD